MNSTMSPAAGQITGAPVITLVDVEGFGVPDCERHSPVCDREPCPADSWPAWTDLVVAELGPAADDVARGTDRLFDAVRDFVGRAIVDPPCPDAAGEEPRPTYRGDIYEPTPEDWAAYHRWSQEVEARRLGLLLPPVRGGAPEPDEAWLEEPAEVRENGSNHPLWF